MALLQLREVRRRFMLGETAIDALHGVSLEIHAGEFLAVRGHLEPIIQHGLARKAAPAG
jgi:ABC-type dipeptide/oligopeptide/nickel transport system ATPase subunit